jgi:hypothetical protein
MAERDFYNVNDQISFPFIHGDPTGLTPVATLPKRGFVDAGFVMGVDSEFDPSADSVYLHSFYVSLGSVAFDFRSDAAGFAGYRFLFTIPAGTPFGATCYEDANPIGGGPGDPDIGRGFITIGDLTDILALGDTLWTLNGILHVEPALIQTEVGNFVTDVSVGNKARCCPTACPGGSSSSASPCDPSAIYFQSRGLVGDLLFREGNNISIRLDQDNNALHFDALIGYGMGKSCEGAIIEGDGEFVRGDFCLSCDELIRSVNGYPIPDGKLVIEGYPGVEITPDPANHRVYVTLNPEKFCEGS